METWLYDNISGSIASLAGFQLVWADRNCTMSSKKKRGEVAIYVNKKCLNSWHITVKKSVCSPNTELLAVCLCHIIYPKRLQLQFYNYNNIHFLCATLTLFIYHPHIQFPSTSCLLSFHQRPLQLSSIRNILQTPVSQINTITEGVRREFTCLCCVKNAGPDCLSLSVFRGCATQQCTVFQQEWVQMCVRQVCGMVQTKLSLFPTSSPLQTEVENGVYIIHVCMCMYMIQEVIRERENLDSHSNAQRLEMGVCVCMH